MKTRNDAAQDGDKQFQAWELVPHSCPLGEVWNDGKEN
jgi:hypothetical protein